MIAQSNVRFEYVIFRYLFRPVVLIMPVVRPSAPNTEALFAIFVLTTPEDASELCISISDSLVFELHVLPESNRQETVVFSEGLNRSLTTEPLPMSVVR